MKEQNEKQMDREELLMYTGIVNKMLDEIGSDWRLGMISKAWPEDMEGEGIDGGVGMLIWVFKTPVRIKGEREDVWIVHPKSHDLYVKRCGNPEGRWPMILNQALKIVGVKK